MTEIKSGNTGVYLVGKEWAKLACVVGTLVVGGVSAAEVRFNGIEDSVQAVEHRLTVQESQQIKSSDITKMRDAVTTLTEKVSSLEKTIERMGQ